ncbi:MAG: glycosyltransferase [Planctomycetota bacterium]
MRVLMLGWEFPPHISGGLGTACHGISHGLLNAGVEVQFVVPCVYGDECTGAVELIGCNQLASSTPAETEAANANAPARGEASGTLSTTANGEARRSGPAGTLERLTVASALSPYLTPSEYARRRAHFAAFDGGDPARSDVGLDAELVAHWRHRFADLDALPVPEAWQCGAAARAPGFSGRYGNDLLAEVSRYAVAVAELARTRTFDVVHAHDWMTFPAGLLTAAVMGKPLVTHTHATEYDRSGENVNTVIRAIERHGMHHATRVVAVSRYTAGVIQNRYEIAADKIRVVHNAVAPGPDRRRSPAADTNAAPVVLFMGRVTFQKGPDYFLAAAARVLELAPHVRFVMAGAGDMLTPMIERAAELGIARNMHFTGFLKGPDVDRMFALADVYVMPSVSEPFGIAPLEALAREVPVIVSRQSGVAEVLTNALKVDFWDVDELANKILALLNYRPLNLQLREEGRTEVARMSWDVPGRKLRRVYEELVA